MLRPRHSQLFPPFAALVPSSAAAFLSSSHVWRPLDEGAGTPVRGGRGAGREGEGGGAGCEGRKGEGR